MPSGLSDKTLVMLIAPSAMGKSTIVREVLARDARFGRVRSFTTRPPRADDESEQFFYFSDTELEQKRTAGELVTDLLFPSTGYTYGTVAESYPSEYCVLETLAHSVADYRALEFKQTIAISITAPSELWHRRFVARYPQPSSEAEKRLAEAVSSIEWSLTQTYDHFWVVNRESPEIAAQKIIDITLGGSSGDDGRADATACLASVTSMWT